MKKYQLYALQHQKAILTAETDSMEEFNELILKVAKAVQKIEEPLIRHWNRNGMTVYDIGSYSFYVGLKIVEEDHVSIKND